MQIIQAPRASAILYNVLVAAQEKHPWLLPANICPIVPITFLKAKVPFQFVDISAATLHMDLEQAETLIKGRTFGGLLYAHTYGDASTPNRFFESIKAISPKLMIIDDRCLCVPDLEPGLTSQADVQLYSTGYAKIVGLNSGGYAFVRDDISYRSVDLLFNPADHERVENSYKQAVHRHEKFVYQDCDWLDTNTYVPSWSAYRQSIETMLQQSLEQRASLNQIYRSMLPGEIQLPAEFQIWRFNVCVKNKSHILEKIFSAGLFASSHYASLADIMGDGQTPCAEGLAEKVINLFNDYYFTSDQAEQTCKIIMEYLA